MPTESYIYSVPYLLFATFLILLMFWEFRNLKFEKENQLIRWFTIIGFIYFFGLRGLIYTDWQVYYYLFQKLPTFWDGGLSGSVSQSLNDYFATDVNKGTSGVEIGFLYFSVFLKSIFQDYYVWVFVNTVIDILLLDIIIRRYSPYYVLSFLLFFAFGGTIIEVNLMRNVKTILLFLISIRFIEDRKIWPYMLLNIVGLLFHSSAILFLPLYFILFKKWPNWLLWSFFIGGFIVIVFKIGFLEPILRYISTIVEGRISVIIKLYLASDLYNKDYSLGLGFFERTITFVLIMIFQKRLLERNPRNQIFMNAFVLYYITFNYFTEIMVVIDRITLLFIFSYWILYPEILSIIKELHYKWLLLSALILYSCLKIAMMNTTIFSKYDNVLFGLEDIEVRQQRMNYYFESVIEPEK